MGRLRRVDAVPKEEAVRVLAAVRSNSGCNAGILRVTQAHRRGHANDLVQQAVCVEAVYLKRQSCQFAIQLPVELEGEKGCKCTRSRAGRVQQSNRGREREIRDAPDKK